MIALAKKPQQRYATPTELARDLRAAFAGMLAEATRDRAGALDPRSSAPGLAPTLSITPQTDSAR